MKKIFFLSLIFSGIFFSCSNGSASGATAKFKVWGNCGMCKETIEGSLKKDGITKADWNTTSKIIEITYDTTKISLDKIHESIASVGYDTELRKGSDSAYAELPGCCQYERK
jgi:copper chaperone CopZ